MRLFCRINVNKTLCGSRMLSVKELLEHYNSFNKFVKQEYDTNYNVSQFWQDIFESRSNFPSFNELLTFQRGMYLVGVGKDNNYDEATESQIWQGYRELVRHSVPDWYLKELNEPIVGSPFIYTDGECTMSASYLLNTVHSYTITKLCTEYGLSSPRIAEIGPGWGALSSQLIQSLQPKSYALIDLPENLLLSSTVLRCTAPNRSHSFLDNPVCESELISMFPPQKDLKQDKFDLIINSFSFQEMELDVVQDYLSWAKRKLSENGILVSINSHGKTSVSQPTDYVHNGLGIVQMQSFRKTPPGVNNTVPYLLVMQRGNSTVTPSTLSRVGKLAQLGLEIDTLFDEENIHQQYIKAFKALAAKDKRAFNAVNLDAQAQPYAYLRVQLIAHSLGYTTEYPAEIVNSMPWLASEYDALWRTRPKRSLLSQLCRTLSTLREEILAVN